jgi:hypothetical protein
VALRGTLTTPRAACAAAAQLPPCEDVSGRVPGLIPASQPRTWTFPRWTVRMVVFIRGSTHRIDRACQRAEALFTAPHALRDSLMGKRKLCVGRADRGPRECTAAVFLDF